MSNSTDQWVQFMGASITMDGDSEAAAWSSVHRGSCPPNGSSKSSTPRRRSRASRKAPTTLLNANTTNFRDLVQQFTGFQAAGASVALGSQRGPVNLSFGAGGRESDGVISCVMVPFSESQRCSPIMGREYDQLRQKGYPNLENNSSTIVAGSEGSSSDVVSVSRSEYLQLQEINEDEGMVIMDGEFSLNELEYFSCGNMNIIGENTNNNGFYFP